MEKAPESPRRRLRRARLELLLAEFGGAAQVARESGTPKSHFSAMVNGTRGMGDSLAAKLEELYGKPQGWFDQPLPTNMGTEEDQNTVKMLSLPTASTESTDVVIPQFETGGAMGHGLVLQDQPGIIKEWRVSDDWLRLNVPHFTAKRNLTIVTGFGSSMKPMFNPGDPLLVDKGVRTIDHEGVYFFRVGDEGYIKMVQRVPEFDGGGFVFRIISKNSDYPPYDISPKNPHFEVLGKVLTVWRSEQH